VINLSQNEKNYFEMALKFNNKLDEAIEICIDKEIKTQLFELKIHSVYGYSLEYFKYVMDKNHLDINSASDEEISMALNNE
jgi:hypothetical protein